MGLRWPRSERYGAQGPPWLYPQKVQSRAVTLLGERPTGQKRTQRAASLILGQPPRYVTLDSESHQIRAQAIDECRSELTVAHRVI
jgi:hypothetical protein